MIRNMGNFEFLDMQPKRINSAINDESDISGIAISTRLQKATIGSSVKNNPMMNSLNTPRRSSLTDSQRDDFKIETNPPNTKNLVSPEFMTNISIKQG